MGFSDEELIQMSRQVDRDGSIEAECPKCGDLRTVEPDAENYPCFTEGCGGLITSPLRQAGLI